MATCKEKVWFASSKEANRKVRRLRNVTSKKLSAYHCDDCGGYHITSKLGVGYKIKVRRSRSIANLINKTYSEGSHAK